MADQEPALDGIPVRESEEVDIDALAPTVAEINLGNLRHNTRVLKRYAGRADLMGVVKANAYGHGAMQVVHVLQEEGIRDFAVATLPEAIRLRQAGITDSILVFAAPLPQHLPYYASFDVGITISSLQVAETAVEVAKKWGPLRVHIKVDTGMGRIGLLPNEIETALRLLEQTNNIEIAGLWTHFAMADEEHDTATSEQLKQFQAVFEQFGDRAARIHIANSPAVLRYTEELQDFDRALVRAGIALYGYTNLPELTNTAGLRPVMTVRSHVIHTKVVAPGTPISYGHTWRSPGWRRIATVSAGYADGYPRIASNKAEVTIGGNRYPQVGKVCMDMFMVDLGEPSGPGEGVQVGDEVILFGDAGPSAYELALWAESIPYEITCRVSARVPRMYVDNQLET